MIWANIRPAYQTRLTRPEVNVAELDGAYVLQLALPGWEKDEVTLEVDGELLHVRGERANDEAEAPTFRRQEFGLRKFDKSFHLPETVDVASIGAAMERGVLNVTLPKVAEAQPVRKAIAVA